MIELWLAAVRDHPHRPGPLQRHVLTMLALRLDWSTGRGFASVRDIAADADASDHTVKRATGWARSDAVGLLHRTRRGHRLGNGTLVASEWQLVCPPSQRATEGTLIRPQGAGSGTLRPSQSARDPLLKVPAGDSQSAPTATHQESSSSQPSSSARPSAADTIRLAFPDATDEEIEKCLRSIQGQRHPTNLDAYTAALRTNQSLRLPCDRNGGGRHSEACRSGQSASCRISWCCCRCHTTPNATPTPGRRLAPVADSDSSLSEAS